MGNHSTASQADGAYTGNARARPIRARARHQRSDTRMICGENSPGSAARQQQLSAWMRRRRPLSADRGLRQRQATSSSRSSGQHQRRNSVMPEVLARSESFPPQGGERLSVHNDAVLLAVLWSAAGEAGWRLMPEGQLRSDLIASGAVVHGLPDNCRSSPGVGLARGNRHRAKERRCSNAERAPAPQRLGLLPLIGHTGMGEDVTGCCGRPSENGSPAKDLYEEAISKRNLDYGPAQYGRGNWPQSSHQAGVVSPRDDLEEYRRLRGSTG